MNKVRCIKALTRMIGNVSLQCFYARIRKIQEAVKTFLEANLLVNIHTFRADMNQPDVKLAAKGDAICAWDFSSFYL